VTPATGGRSRLSASASSARPLRRLWVWAPVAIVVPAAIVAVLGIVSLRQWERSAGLLFREQARDLASMAVDKLEMVLRRAEDGALARLSAVLQESGPRPEALDAYVADTPLIQRLYVLDQRGRILYPEGAKDGEVRAFAALLTEVAQGFWVRGGRRDLVVDEAPVLAAVLPAAGDTRVLAALVRSVEEVRREVFETTLKGLEAPTICAVVNARGEAVYTQAPLHDADLVVAVPFRESLPQWRVALYQPRGTSPAAAVRRQVMVFMATLAVLLLVIVAGIVATYRLVRRETEMAQLKADFVANVSHDLKTPLSVIRMFGETLEMGRVREEASRQEYYRVITRESERLSRLIDNVLDFSRIEGGRRTYERVPTAVEPLVRDVLEAFAYPLAQQGFKVDVDVAADLPEVALDRDAVGQALANLVDNAVKYSAERKVLEVRARVVDGQLAIAVRDEGIGIPAPEHGRIFDKFYRVGRSETQGRRGSGVGLALVRHVAEAHGGRVTLQSRPGEGSCFTLWFPL
jgi:signal transduction histidine kinase